MTRNWRSKIVIDPVTWRKGISELVGCTLVLTNGCFDLLHIGHIDLLYQCSKVRDGDGVILMVAVNSDASVRSLKGPTRPVVPEDQRLSVLAGVEYVDYCMIFHETRCDQVIRTVRPHVWVKGGDYTLNTLDSGERAAAEEVHAKILIVPYTHGISTSELITRSKTLAAG